MKITRIFGVVSAVGVTIASLSLLLVGIAAMFLVSAPDAVAQPKTPSPHLCMLSFVNAAKKASTIEQLYPYLIAKDIEEMKAAKPEKRQKTFMELRKLAYAILNAANRKIEGNTSSVNCYVAGIHTTKVYLGGKTAETGQNFITVYMELENSYWKYKLDWTSDNYNTRLKYKNICGDEAYD